MLKLPVRLQKIEVFILGQSVCLFRRKKSLFNNGIRKYRKIPRWMFRSKIERNSNVWNAFMLFKHSFGLLIVQADSGLSL